MTLDDKLAMVDGVGFSTGTAGYVGHIAANPQLCIPALNLEDGPQGVADNVPGVTQLPAPVALAASWDPALARAYGSVVGSEERGKGADVNLGPTVNIVRDPRWGRAFETYGEDPYLAGQTAVGYIGGVQSQGVMSQVKHLRRVQPGDQPQHGRRQRHRQPADHAGDLPAAVRGGGDAGPGGLRDVQLLERQRPVRLREQVPADERAQATSGTSPASSPPTGAPPIPPCRPR